MTLQTKLLNLYGLQRSETNHYATLGLDRQCTLAQIRAAYRVLARQHHPDLNPDSPSSLKRTQELNAAYEILTDPEKRARYDQEPAPPAETSPARPKAQGNRNVSQDLNLRFEEFLRGATREVTVHDPANPDGPETYQLVVPPETAPGTRFRLSRHGPFAGGFVNVRVKAQPAFQFKVRGCDLRCDLKIKSGRAAQGGMEMIRGVTGNPVRVTIPRGIGRDEIIRIPGEGLPKPRGGRGDLLVRIVYRVEVRFARASAR